MEIKRHFTSTGFRFVSRYVLFYVITTLGFMVLMLNIVEAEIGETTGLASRIALWVVPSSILLAFLGGLTFNSIVKRRIEVINEHCRSIRVKGDLSQRIPNTRPRDEYGRLIININDMLDAIDKGVQSVQAV